MFIAQVIASRGIDGGLEKHVRELSMALVKQNHQVIVFGDPAFLNTLPECIAREPINMRLGRYHPWLLWQLYRKLKCYPFDIIHAQANKAASLIASLKLFIRKPSLATVHNLKSQYRVFNRFKQVICVSQALAAQISHHKTAVIYNGIQAPIKSPDCSQYQQDIKTQFDLPPQQPVLCAIGRLVPAKGFDMLLEAVNGLPISLIIAGEGAERNKLTNKIKHLSPLTTYRLIGNHADVPYLMRHCDGTIISSRREGFSYVLNEALLCKTNVISTDVPVANEVLPRDLIVPVNDAAALRQKLMLLLADPQQWASQMQQAQLFAEQEMTLSKMTDKTLNVYQNVIASSWL